MSNIVLQFCGFNSFWGKLIPWYTQGVFEINGWRYSIGHVDAVMPDGSLLGSQEQDDLGGMPSGVQIRPEDYGDTCGMKDRLRVSIPATKHQSDAFSSFLMSQVGKPYDVRAIEGFAAGREWREPDAWFCSELICAALEASGLIRTIVAHTNKVTPAMLLCIVSTLAEVKPYD